MHQYHTVVAITVPENLLTIGMVMDILYRKKKKCARKEKNHFHFDPAGFILMEQINSAETRWITRDLMCKTFALVCVWCWLVWLELCRAAHSF